jgi:hypothetical protein
VAHSKFRIAESREKKPGRYVEEGIGSGATYL